MKKIATKVFAVALAAIMLAGCAATGKKKQPLRVGLMSDVNSIPFIVAKQQGLFDPMVELEIFRGPADRDSALMSGNLEGCSTDVLAVCLAHNGGAPIYITAATSGDYGVLAGKDTGIENAAHLSGKQVALSLNTIIEYITDCILEEQGVDPATVIKTSVPKTPSRLELLEAGQIEAIAVPEPFVSAGEAGGAVVIGRASQLNILPCTMAFTKESLENNAAAIEKFHKAYDQALEYMAKTPAEEYLPQAVEELGLPQNTLEMTLPNYLPAALPERQQVERASQWLADKQITDKAYTYEELIWQK